MVNKWVFPAIPANAIRDQFAFRTTGSTTCALVNLLHHVGYMLETNNYVRCLTIDFSKAFDVNHSVLLRKVSALELPDSVHNWVVSFLIGRRQINVLLTGCVLPISRGIIQGSGVGPTFYIILKSDLNPLSANNVLSKYADDLNLLVPQHCDVSLATEFDHIRKWADDNKMTINTTKTKEIVFRRPSPLRFHLLPSIQGIQLVDQVKSLGVILHEGLSFDLHVTSLLKQCSQRIYLLRLLRSQGMSSNHLNTIFHAIIVSRILYALPAWGVFMSAAQSGRIDAFLKRAHKCGFSKELLTVNELLVESGKVMFKKIKSPTHCLHMLCGNLATGRRS